MTQPAQPPPTDRLLAKSPLDLTATLDTTASSCIHRLFGCLNSLGRGREIALFMVYVITVVLTYVPLSISAVMGPSTIITPAEAHALHQLPFFLDLAALYAFLVSFPWLMILIATDQDVLTRSLNRVRSDGAITICDQDLAQLAAHWNRRFQTLNVAGQALAVIAGAVVAYVNYRVCGRSQVGFWIVDKDGHLLTVGMVYLYCMFLLYTVVGIFVVRNIAFYLLFKDIVAHSELHMIPAHPDKAGGLLPVGRLGLRNQYAITVFGFNALIFLIVYSYFLKLDIALVGLMAAAIVSYLVLGPLVFLAPLLPFRGIMQRNKSQLMSEVAVRLRRELEQIRKKVPEEPISKEDEELIERLRKIGTVINDLPVWPFDIGTLRRFLTAYIIPVLIPITAASYAAVKVVAPAVEAILKFFFQQ